MSAQPTFYPLPEPSLHPTLTETAEVIARKFGYSRGAIYSLNDGYFRAWAPGGEAPTIRLLRKKTLEACGEHTVPGDSLRIYAFELATRAGFRVEAAANFMPFVDCQGFLRSELTEEVYALCTGASLVRACKPVDGRPRWVRAGSRVVSFLSLAWLETAANVLLNFWLRESLLRDVLLLSLICVFGYGLVVLFMLGGQ